MPISNPIIGTNHLIMLLTALSEGQSRWFRRLFDLDEDDPKIEILVKLCDLSTMCAGQLDWGIKSQFYCFMVEK